MISGSNIYFRSSDSLFEFNFKDCILVKKEDNANFSTINGKIVFSTYDWDSEFFKIY